MNAKPKMLETPRLVLKPLEDGDLETFIRLASDERIKKTYMLPDLHDKAEEEAFFRRMRDICASDAHFMYGIYRMEELIGLLNDCEIEKARLFHRVRALEPRLCVRSAARRHRGALRYGLPDGHGGIFCGEHRQPPRDGEVRHASDPAHGRDPLPRGRAPLPLLRDNARRRGQNIERPAGFTRRVFLL